MPSGSSIVENHIDQEEYEEDHADEERMFRCINELLKKLKMHLKSFDFSVKVIEEVRTMVSMLSTYTGRMARHLKAHLAKEEESCLPLVEKHLDTREIHDLGECLISKYICGLTYVSSIPRNLSRLYNGKKKLSNDVTNS